MYYDKYEQQTDFSLTKNKKKQNSFEKKSNNKTRNTIYSTKHVRKTVQNLNKNNAKK